MKKLFLIGALALGLGFTACENLEDELADANTTIENLEGEIAQLQASLRESASDLAEANARIADQASSIESLNSDLAAIGARLESTLSDLGLTQEARDAALASLAALNELHSGLADELAEEQAALAAAQAALAAAQADSNVDEAAIDALNSQISSLSSRINGLNSRLSTCANEVSRLMSQLNMLAANATDWSPSYDIQVVGTVSQSRTVTVTSSDGVTLSEVQNRDVVVSSSNSTRTSETPRTGYDIPGSADAFFGSREDAISMAQTYVDGQGVGATGTIQIFVETGSVLFTDVLYIASVDGEEISRELVTDETGVAQNATRVDGDTIEITSNAVDPADTPGAWAYSDARVTDAIWDAGMITLTDTSIESISVSRSRIWTINGDLDASTPSLNASNQEVVAAITIRNSAYVAPAADTVAPILTFSVSGGYSIVNNVINVPHDYSEFRITATTDEAGTLRLDDPFGAPNQRIGDSTTGESVVIAGLSGSIVYRFHSTDAAGNLAETTITVVVADAPAAPLTEAVAAISVSGAPFATLLFDADFAAYTDFTAVTTGNPAIGRTLTVTINNPVEGNYFFYTWATSAHFATDTAGATQNVATGYQLAVAADGTVTITNL